MTQYNENDLIPVPRSAIFVLHDGTFVVQWEHNRVQDMLTGRYLNYNQDKFGNAITDYELNQLVKSGVIANFDSELIYLSPSASPQSQAPTRTYYLNTTLNKSRMREVEEALQETQLAGKFSVRVQEIFVIIRGRAGVSFDSFDAAERAREALVERLPHLLGNTVVAFVELNAIS